MSVEVETPSGASPAAPEATGARAEPRWRVLVTPLCALLLSMVIGGLLIVVTDEEVRSSASYFFSRPVDALSAAWGAASSAYWALFKGSVVDPAALSSGSLTRILRPISETLTYATPVILCGLSVALAFRSGLFNIGAQGQLILGAIFAGWVGFTFSLPAPLHVTAAVLAGVLGGLLWGGIVGVLKAWRGAHEVIVTIMLNYVAIYLLGWLLNTRGFQAPPYDIARSEEIAESAALLRILGADLRANLGILLALLAAVGMWWLLDRSTVGFRLRAVGSNPAAARTAGMSVPRTYALAMLLAGALAGAAGAAQVLGPSRSISGSIDNGAGFDGITAALLGRGKPLGVVLAGLLFGALRAGATRMQSEAQTPVDLVLVLQALIVLFIAAPPLIQAVFRIPAGSGLRHAAAKGWSS